MQEEQKIEALPSSIISMAVESWRFKRVFQKAMEKLDIIEREKYMGQYNWFLKKVNLALDEANLRIVNVEGQRFEIGMSVIPLNIEEFDSNENLIVEQMQEPIIMNDEKVMKLGSVILGREI